MAEEGSGISASLLWNLLKGFYAQAAEKFQKLNPSLDEKLQR
jgi:hypothetical protein